MMSGKLYGKSTRVAAKLLGSLRGAGELLWTGDPVAVVYQLDLYRAGDERTGRGTLEGDLAALEAAGPRSAVLRLASGFEAPITLVEIDAEGADFDAAGALPDLDRS